MWWQLRSKLDCHGYGADVGGVVGVGVDVGVGGGNHDKIVNVTPVILINACL